MSSPPIRFPDSDDAAAFFDYLFRYHQEPVILADLKAPSSPFAFQAAAQKLMAAAVEFLEPQAKTLGRQSEPGWCVVLMAYICGAGIAASQQSIHVGHVDIAITYSRDPRFKYLVEAKRWRGPAYHENACPQIVGYSGPDQSMAMILLFFEEPHLVAKMKEARSRAERLEFPGQVGYEPINLPRQAFFTRHQKKSELGQEDGSLLILHYPCDVSDAK